MRSKYKSVIKKKMYKNYLLSVHSEESNIKYTSTKIANSEILSIFQKFGKKKILDAGCGDGQFIMSALENGLYCEGFDNNPEMINLCRRKGYKVKKGDFSYKLPFSDNTFEGIFCSNVFEHLEDPDFAFYELLRILKKNGILIITVPEYDKLFWSDWTHIRPFTIKTLESLVSCTKIKNYRIYRRNFAFFVKYWKNPLVRFINYLLRKGIHADLFSKIFESILKIRRHDLVLIVRK